MKDKGKTILLVNPTSSSTYLSEELATLNYRTIALYDDFKNISDTFKPEKNSFDKQIKLNSASLSESLFSIQEKVDYVLNAADHSLELTEYLTKALTPFYTSGPETLSRRIDKFSQQEALQASNLPYIKQISTSRNNINITAINALDFPVFCKPVEGAASIGAFKAETISDVIKGIENSPMQSIYGSNDDYIIQEFIDGNEFFVDSFSINGEHFNSAVYEYKKVNISGAPVYQSISPVHCKVKNQQLSDFASLVLNTCEYRNGFAHTEVFQLEDGSCRLIEVNPRISGMKGSISKFTIMTGLPSQIELLNKHLKEINIIDRRRIDNIENGHLVLLYNQQVDFDEIFSYVDHVDTGAKELTCLSEYDLGSSSQYVFICNSDINILNSDLSALLDADKTKLLALC